MILCIDIGGTAIKYGLAPLKGPGFTPGHIHEEPTNAKDLGGPLLQEKVLTLTASYLKKYALKGVAVSTAGMVDAQSGAIIYANENIPRYTGINLKAAVEERFSLPCWVENDVRAAALGEYAYGAGRGSGSMLCMTIGTGIGGALIIDGKIHRGYCRSAGEIGYMVIKGQEFQKIASTSALVESVQKATGEKLNGRLIFERAKKGDALCQRAIADICDTIAQGAACALCVANPETLVLGGGIMAQTDYLKPLMEEALQKYVQEYIYKHTRFAFAELANGAGMAGAFHYWKSMTGSRGE